MNQRDIEKQIWGSLLTMARNLYEFDRAEYERLRHGFEDDEWDWRDAQPLTSERRQERFDRALNRVIGMIRRKGD